MTFEVALMALLAMTSVALWTLRVAVAARGMKLVGAVVAAVEAVVFALTFSQLVTDLGSPVRIAGYGIGVAMGTAAGLTANDRLTPGHTELHLIVHGEEAGLGDSLHLLGWPATLSAGWGPRGPVTQAWVTVDDDRVDALVADVRDVAPSGFWTLQRLRGANPSALSVDCHQIRARRVR